MDYVFCICWEDERKLKCDAKLNETHAILLWRHSSYVGLLCSLVGLCPGIDENIREHKNCVIIWDILWISIWHESKLNQSSDKRWNKLSSLLFSLSVVKSRHAAFSCCFLFISLLFSYHFCTSLMIAIVSHWLHVLHWGTYS